MVQLLRRLVVLACALAAPALATAPSAAAKTCAAYPDQAAAQKARDPRAGLPPGLRVVGAQRLVVGEGRRLPRLRAERALQRGDRRGRPPDLARARRFERAREPVPRVGEPAPGVAREGPAREQVI